MRVRKASVRWKGGAVSIDFRNKEGQVLPIVSIEGKHNSGKSLLLKFIANVWRESMEGQFGVGVGLAVDGEVEFETAEGITSTVVREGKSLQKAKLPRPDLPKITGVSDTFGNQDIRDGLLYFDALTRMRLCDRIYADSHNTGAKLVSVVLSDLINHKVRNSVILVDDVDFGLGDEDACRFMDEIMKRMIAGDNQLIVTSQHISIVGGLDASSIRRLGGGGATVVEEAMKLIV